MKFVIPSVLSLVFASSALAGGASPLSPGSLVLIPQGQDAFEPAVVTRVVDAGHVVVHGLDQRHPRADYELAVSLLLPEAKEGAGFQSGSRALLRQYGHTASVERVFGGPDKDQVVLQLRFDRDVLKDERANHSFLFPARWFAHGLATDGVFKPGDTVLLKQGLSYPGHDADYRATVLELFDGGQAKVVFSHPDADPSIKGFVTVLSTAEFVRD